MDDQALIAKHFSKVTELRFGKNIKICKRGAFRDRPAGWHLLVEGPAGGFIMKASDGFLYHTQGRDSDPFNDPEFVFTNVVDAVNKAEALEANLDDNQRVIDPSRGFISKFLNPVSFDRQHDYWRSNEARIQLKCR